MPDAPLYRSLDPASIQRERQAKAKSPLYHCHPTVTVWEYTRMKRPEQEQVQRECRAIEQAKKDTKKPAG